MYTCADMGKYLQFSCPCNKSSESQSGQIVCNILASSPARGTKQLTVLSAPGPKLEREVSWSFFLKARFIPSQVVAWMWVISSCPCCSIHLGTSTSTRFLWFSLIEKCIMFAPMNLTEPIANVPSCNNVNYESDQESPPPPPHKGRRRSQKWMNFRKTSKWLFAIDWEDPCKETAVFYAY